jgi:hypothetical protein
MRAKAKAKFPSHQFARNMSARLADVAHKTLVTVLAGVTVVGLVDIGAS